MPSTLSHIYSIITLPLKSIGSNSYMLIVLPSLVVTILGTLPIFICTYTLNGVSVFGGVGERTIEGNDLWNEFKESGVFDKVGLFYGQINEPPGARMRVGLSGLTAAEFFRDFSKHNVLLFIDNIFRSTQAGSEVSALLGRMPSAVGYQPSLATEMGELQERITSSKDGSITSVQAIYIPADD